MKRLILPLLLGLPLAAQAALRDCATAPLPNGPDLKPYASVTPAKAHQVAKDVVGGAVRTMDGSLERHGDCLVYRFDIRRVGRGEVEQVVVDAVDGKVLEVGPLASRAVIVEPRPVIVEPVPPRDPPLR